MKITDLQSKLEEIKQREGDLPIITGTQGTESFRDLDENRDMYLFGFKFEDKKIGLVINEDAIEKSNRSFAEANRKAREFTDSLRMKDENN